MIQCQVINRLLDSKDYSLLTINNIGVDFFSDYTEEYLFIVNHINEYGNMPDKATFLNKFPDFDILEVSESNNYLIDALYEDKNKRELASVFNKVRNLINEDKTDEALNLYITAAEKAVKAKHIECVNIIEDTSRYNDYVEKCKDFNKFYIKTGFLELDKLIGGWERAEELVTIAARPGVGKSWIMLKCAVAALEQGLNVGIYSGEMSDKKVGYRFDTLVSHISNYAISKGNVTVQNDYKNYIDSLHTKYKGFLKVLTPSMINGSAGVNALRAFIDKEQLDILFVDQHSLLEDDRKARDPITRASNISKDLKNLQVLKHIPIITVSQQNRVKTDESGATTANIAQTDRISQDSTIIIFLEKQDDILTLHLVKSRDSETGKILKYAVDLNLGIFTYLPIEDDGVSNKQDFDDLTTEYEDEPF